MYDVDGDGFISKKDMKSVLEMFLSAVGSLETLGGKCYTSADKLVDDLFAALDRDGSGLISCDLYKDGAMKNPDIIQGLGIVG